jgi:DNA-binding CsgD family transcriptional regulator
MTVHLSSADIARLRVAATTLVSALEFESVRAWGQAAMRDVMAVLGADKAYFSLPIAGGIETAFAGERTEDGMIAYLSHYWQTDIVLRQRRVELGLEVYHRDMLYRPGEIAHDELHNDWCRPHALYDTLGMGFDVEANAVLPALLHVYHHRDTTTFGDRGVALMQLLLPSFKTGVAAWRELCERRHSLAASLDGLGAAIAMFDADGLEAHRTPALTALLNGDDERTRIEAAVASLARDLTASCCRARRKTTAVALPPTVHRVATRAAHYTIRACVAPHSLVGKPGVLVAVERSTGLRPDLDGIARRYGLTAREQEVSMCLIGGDSTTAIADALGMSPHTVRHHVEHIIAKLRVHSRAEAVARLISERR